MTRLLRRALMVAAAIVLGACACAAWRLVVVRPDSCAGERQAIVVETVVLR